MQWSHAEELEVSAASTAASAATSTAASTAATAAATSAAWKSEEREGGSIASIHSSTAPALAPWRRLVQSSLPEACRRAASGRPSTASVCCRRYEQQQRQRQRASIGAGQAGALRDPLTGGGSAIITSEEPTPTRSSGWQGHRRRRRQPCHASSGPGRLERFSSHRPSKDSHDAAPSRSSSRHAPRDPRGHAPLRAQDACRGELRGRSKPWLSCGQQASHATTFAAAPDAMPADATLC